jgi:hypothetical protein
MMASNRQRPIWLRSKGHFLFFLTASLWVLMSVAFIVAFADAGAREMWFWIFLIAICLLAAYIAALLFWKYFVEERFIHLFEQDAATELHHKRET